MSGDPKTPETEAADAQVFAPGYGKGGVPWFLLLLYLSFLVFFTWYILDNQLPGFLEEGPGQSQVAEE